MLRALPLMCVVLLAGCSQAEQDALVSIFEYDKSPIQQTTCLSVFGRDPSPDLLSRIHKYNANVVASSECTEQEHGGYLYQGQHVLYRMQIEKPKWLGARKVSFEVTYATGAMFGSSGELIVVEKLNEFWVPTSREMTWIS